MRIGDYVRTPKGIGKIIKKYSDLKDSFIDLDCGITIDYITKDFTEEEICEMYAISPNIIDILEVGDYVNGLKVIQMYSPEGKYTLWIKLSDNTFIDNSEEIKSIATKEQFKNIEYEVK